MKSQINKQRTPRFAELDRLIESRGERVHRVRTNGNAVDEMHRIERRRKQRERRALYLQSLGRFGSEPVNLNPELSRIIHSVNRSVTVDAPGH